VTSISAIFALIASSVEKKIAAESTKHELVKLALNKLVAVLFMYFAFAFTNGALPTETPERTVKWTFTNIFLDFTTIQHIWILSMSATY
jgi:hypothetical protein